MNRSVLLLIALFLACGSPRPAKIVVVNECGENLTNLVMAGRGFSHTINELKTGASTTFEAMPTGESGMTITFMTASGRTVSLPQAGYFENGYDVKVVITHRLEAEITSSV